MEKVISAENMVVAGNIIVIKSQNIQRILSVQDSFFASCIVKQHFDPIIGEAQNDYMIDKFQSVPATSGQIRNGYRYYLVTDGEGALLGFLAFYPREESMYLSKFYVDGKKRGRGIARKMFQFLEEETKKENLSSIFLNVNRDNIQVIRIYEHLVFCIIREETNDIGNGFFMEDYVMKYDVQL